MLLGGCADETGSADRASGAPPSPRSAGSAAASMTASSSPVTVTGTVALPAECVDAIRAYLVAVEPVVKDVRWTTMIETPPEIEDQLTDVAATIDPEVCPDLSAAEAHGAWIAIASDAAPATLDYIDYVYRP